MTEFAYDGTRQLTDIEWNALKTYAVEHGRNWKQALRDDWMNGRLSGPLHALRNDAGFGPTGLAKFKLAWWDTDVCPLH